MVTVPGNVNKRLFVAINPSETAREELIALCSGLPDARWTPPKQLHLTLCFIGEVDDRAFLGIREALCALERNGPSAFSLRFRALGFFPPRGEPRVLWAGVAESPALLRLQRQVSISLQGVGIELEKRRFTPHITLARLGAGAASGLKRYLDSQTSFSGSSFVVDRFTLYSSILDKSGATHIPEAEYILPAFEKK